MLETEVVSEKKLGNGVTMRQVKHLAKPGDKVKPKSKVKEEPKEEKKKFEL